MNRFTCISNEKFSLNERRLVWQEAPHDAPDTKRPAILEQEAKQRDAEHMYDKNGKQIDKGPAEMRPATKKERMEVAEANREAAKKAAREKINPTPLTETEIAFNKLMGIEVPGKEEKPQVVTRKKE